jgi:hypothetical protein
MFKSLERSLHNLSNCSVQVTAGDDYPEPWMAPISMIFGDGSKLEARFWRIIKNGKAIISSFDHQQKYGLPVPLNAIETLQREVHNQTVVEANLDKETGDLLFTFTGNVKLRIFNFTGYEVWYISFPDGTGEYSNYVLKPNS